MEESIDWSTSRGIYCLGAVLAQIEDKCTHETDLVINISWVLEGSVFNLELPQDLLKLLLLEISSKTHVVRNF